MRKITVLAAASLLAATCMSLPSTAAVMILPASSKPAQADPDPAKVKAAVAEFNSLSRKEKKERVREVKKAMREYRAEKRSGGDPSTNTLLLVILAILLPPLAVYLHQGEINSKFWIDLILTLIFWIPGVVYALIVILGNQ